LLVTSATSVEKKCSSLSELELPYVSHLQEKASNDVAMSTSFVNLLPRNVERYWDDGTPKGRYQGPVTPGEVTSVGTYEGHVFFFLDGEREIHRFPMRSAESLYIVHGDDAAVLSSEQYKLRVKQQSWMNDYYRRTGTPWLAHYSTVDGPRGPPVHHMWDAKFLGQTHRVQSAVTHWDGAEAESSDEHRVGIKSSLELTLQVVSVAPRVLLIPSLLSTAECELILKLGRDKVRSSSIGTNGGYLDDTRTSRTGWLNRDSDPRLNRIFTRFSDVLKIDDAKMVHGRQGVAESLQVVHYRPGQEYQPHYDFFDTGSNATRCLTLLIYLNGEESATGGGTSFPKAFDGKGLQVRPPRGSAVLFYSLREDGNTDRLSEHAGLPVPQDQGEKWVANLWVWDPEVGF